MADEEIDAVVLFEPEVGNGPVSVPMSTSSSRSSAETPDDSDYRSDSDTSATSGDEDNFKTQETPESTSTSEPTVNEPQVADAEKVEPPSAIISPTAADLDEQSAKQYVSLHQFLLPKVRLLRILLQIDPLAGSIIIGNTIAVGFLNSLKASTATVLTAAILELILTKQTDTQLILRLLCMHLIYEVCIHIMSGINCYAHRRARRPLQKKLGTDLMKAYAALPYEMMLNKEISRDFAESCWTISNCQWQIIGTLPLVRDSVEALCNFLPLIDLAYNEPNLRFTLWILGSFHLSFTILKLYRIGQRSKKRKHWSTRYLSKNREHRRRSDLYWSLLHSNTPIKRDVHLLNTVPWFISEFNLTMDRLIAQPWSFIKKYQDDFIDDMLNTLYDLFSKFSLPAAVLFYGLELNFSSHSVLADRFASVSRCVTGVGQTLVTKKIRDHVAMYFQCLEIGREENLKKRKTFDARVEDLNREKNGWEIEIKNVDFAYPSGGESSDRRTLEKKVDSKDPKGPDYVLKDFNFTFERGKTYSLVGHNGRGKTTLIQLLAGLYTPSSGQILINGVDMQSLNITELRQKMSFLFQDFARYSDFETVENILMGDLTNKNESLAHQRAEQTGVDFVSLNSTLCNLEKQPKNADETWHSQLSGGQWQKIALARAFMRADAEVLVLDEPTSALDIEAEHRLFKLILEQRKGKTTMFVTHRLNTTKIADCIVVLQDGKVHESGSHEELMKLDGEYARLVKIQDHGYDSLTPD